MKQFLTYTCNVCKKPGLLNYDDHAEDGMEYDFSQYQTMLCHTRCGDFQAVKDRETRNVDAVLTWLAKHKAVNKRDGKVNKNAEYEEKARRSLVSITRRFCRAVCAYYRKPFAWEPDFVTMILEKPEKWFHCLNFYEKTQSKI